MPLYHENRFLLPKQEKTFIIKRQKAASWVQRSATERVRLRECLRRTDMRLINKISKSIAFRSILIVVTLLIV